MRSSDSVCIKSTPTGATILGVAIYFMGSKTIKFNDEAYELTVEKRSFIVDRIHLSKYEDFF